MAGEQPSEGKFQRLLSRQGRLGRTLALPVGMHAVAPKSFCWATFEALRACEVACSIL